MEGLGEELPIDRQPPPEVDSSTGGPINLMAIPHLPVLSLVVLCSVAPLCDARDRQLFESDVVFRFGYEGDDGVG